MKAFWKGLVASLITLVAVVPTSAQKIDVSDYRSTLIQMIGAVRDAREGALNDPPPPILVAVTNSDDPLYIAPLLDLAFFTRQLATSSDAEIFRALAALTGENFGADWERYFTWASENDIELPPHYAEFKGLLLASFLDAEFARFFPPNAAETAQVNLLEAVWGGVLVDGIPALVNARQVSPAEAEAEGLDLPQYCRDDDCRYPAPDELVFGVSLNGDNRAYPLRLLNWHEMFNDVIGRTPMFDAPEGEEICQFRAPTPFHALQRQGDDWVKITGESAGCDSEGWIASTAIDWDWASVRDQLPEDSPLTDLATAPMGAVKGQPVMLAYCTLCGAGILYDTTIPDLVIDGESQGETVLEFGSTGMLMRSNKLMYDRNTDTVWNALTGTPAFGKLAGGDLQLEVLPVVVSDWATWLEAHPDTSVLSLQTGYRRNYSNGGAYQTYFNDPNFIMFPVWQQDTSRQENKEMIFALTLNGIPKAYPLEVLIQEGVSHDSIGDEDVVIISRATPDREFFEPGGAVVRAYTRLPEFTFSVGEQPNTLVDQDGMVWQITEEGLIAENRRVFQRLGGHLAFWFGWYSFHPQTLVYEGN